MTRSRLAVLLIALLATAGCQGFGRSGSGSGRPGAKEAGQLPPLDLATVDVCARIPGPMVAEAVGGQRAEILSFRGSGQQHARCRYSVTGGPSAAKAQVFVVWLLPAAEFDALRLQQENPATPVANLGDGAYVSTIAGTQRSDLYVLKRGVATLEITGDDRRAVTKIAKLALTRL
jgi:hypothetical protein